MQISIYDARGTILSAQVCLEYFDREISSIEYARTPSTVLVVNEGATLGDIFVHIQ
jgi:hypothetical protein